MAVVQPSAGLSSRAKFLPPLAGLLVAATVAGSPGLPSNRLLSWPELLGSAAQRVLTVSLACVVTISALYAILMRRHTPELEESVLKMSLAAMWLAPLTLFIRENSIGTTAIAAVFTVVLTQFFFSALAPASWILSESSPAFFQSPEYVTPSLHLNFTVSAAAALCVQAGALLTFSGHALAAASLVGVGFFIWTRSATSYAAAENRQDSLSPPARSRGAVSVALAILLTAVGLFPFLRRGGGLPFGSERSRWHAFAGGQRELPLRIATEEDKARAASEGNSGIVLWAGKQIVTKLVAPTPTHETRSYSNFQHADPLVIPFSGVYWFFKAPDTQPPKSSQQAHVSPETVEIRSTDRRPLSIEAHDHLGQLIDLSCCSKIQIAIRNADRYPETVSLELILVNTSLPDKPTESLGRIMVKSTRPWSLYEKRMPSSETLSFAIPPTRSLRRFDEVKIVFELDRARADAAAKMAIDHLVLVPREF